MARHVTGWMFVICALAANRLLAADGQRFSDQAETTIGVFVGDQAVQARLWGGRFEVVAKSDPHPHLDMTAIYLPGARLLWWALGYAPPYSTAKALQEFKKNARCVADRGAITCFGAIHWYVGATRSGERMEGTDIAALVGKRIAQLDPEAVHRQIASQGRLISLVPITALKPLYELPGGPGSGLGSLYYVTKAVPDQNGWELTIHNSGSGRVGVVRLDGEMHPVSGKMIK